MPTPVEHYEEAERLLDEAHKAADPLAASRLVNRATVEATLAAVPWASGDAAVIQGLGLDADDVASLITVAAGLADWVDTRGGGEARIPDGVDPEGYVEGMTRARSAVADLLRLARPILEAIDE